MQRATTKRPLITFVEGGIIVAICLVLQFIPNDLGVSSIQFSYGLIPLAIYAMRRGTIPAVIAGGAWGVLDWIRSGGVVSFGVWQVFLEYPLAFALAGLMGVGSTAVLKQLDLGNKNRAYLYLFASFFLGTFAKYLAHFTAGVWFWGNYAPSWANPWLWSLIVNGGSVIANLVLGGVILWIITKSYPRLFKI